MRNILLPLLVTLQLGYICPTILVTPFRCFIWDARCVTALAQSLAPKYIQRLPDVSLEVDPIKVDYIRLEKDGFLFETTDLKIQGLKNVVIDELRSYPNTSVGHLIFRTDILYTGLYKTNGTLYYTPISGEGDFWALLRNMEVELFIPYDIVKNANGQEHIEASDYQFRYDVKDNAQFHLNNLYFGDTESSELMHSLLNLNWKFATANYGRTFVESIIDVLAKAYKNYFRITPLRSLVEY